MQKTTILYIIIVGLIGFIAGFMVANFLNRSEYSVSGASGNLTNGIPAGQPGTSDLTLSPEEIKAKIAEADQNAGNFAYQKDLGLALYRYAAMKHDDDLLVETARILERARTLDPRDVDVLIGLGNAHFDIGFYRKDLVSFKAARDTYAKALALSPDDLDVRTDLGISYFVQEPPEYDRAEAELKKVIAKDPRHSRSLQFLVQVYTRQNRISEARAALDSLRSISPNNPAVKELSSQIAAAEGDQGK